MLATSGLAFEMKNPFLFLFLNPLWKCYESEDPCWMWMQLSLIESNHLDSSPQRTLNPHRRANY